MDVMRKLQSILSPGNVAANRSQSRPSKAEVPDQPSFAERLRAATRTEVTKPQLTPEQPRTADVAFDPPAPPAIDLPAAREIPIEPVVVELGDTLESAVSRERDRLYGPSEASTAAQTAATEDDQPAAPGVAAAASSVASEPAPSLLPPIGVSWSGLVLRGSGASGLGVAGDDATTALDLVNKHEYYNNPGKYGLVPNGEARLFLDAVDKGYVPNTPAGLGTLLATLSKGTVGPDARPPEITAYFHQFFATERARVNV